MGFFFQYRKEIREGFSTIYPKRPKGKEGQKVKEGVDPYAIIRFIDDCADGKFCQTHEQVYEQNWIGCHNYISYKINENKKNAAK